MSIKRYQLYCEICNYKKITTGHEAVGFVELSTSPIPGGIPFLDNESKIVVPKSKSQPKKLKCPKCGRLIIPRKLATPKDLEQKSNEKDRTDGGQASS